MADSKKNVPIFPKLNKPNFKGEALKWHRFGFTVIPIRPGEKRSVTVWSKWEGDHQTEEHIKAHWAEHPKHEVGAVTDDGFIVLDADTPKAIKAIEELEKAHGLVCDLVVTTSRGEHHYYKLAPDTFAKQDSHDGKQYPERIDIRTGRSLIILPPSGSRKIKVCNVDNISQLSVASQDFIDAVFSHNGRDVPRLAVKKEVQQDEPSKLNNHTQAEIRAYLDYIDPDCGYEDWRNIGMSLHNEFEGSDIGLDIFDEWSSKADKYDGQGSLDKKWLSFANYNGIPITIGSLLKMAIDNGADVQEIQSKHGFEICETVVIQPETISTDTDRAVESSIANNPLAKFVLNNDLEDMQAQVQDEVFILAGIALMGQLTNLYAKPNSGKTLLVLYELIQVVKNGIIKGENIYYIDADDGYGDLVTKIDILKKHDINVLAPNHKGFISSDLTNILQRVIEKGLAKGIVLIFDTLKKFTDIMSKSAASEFWKVLRGFSAKGGTVISLAHTNKKEDQNGKPVYAGTTDSLDDCDCGYTLRRLDSPSKEPVVFAELENIKNRGSVAMKAVYQFSVEEGLSYRELLDSVRKVEEDELARLTSNTSNRKVDEPRVIDAIIDCISEGINKKMVLAKAVAEATGESRNAVTRILEKYTGTDSLESKWNFKVVERGAKMFYTLDSD